MNGYGSEIGNSKLASLGDIQERGAGASTPKGVPPMDVSVRALGQNIERLMQAVQLLSGKLDPVLYPEPPTNQAMSDRAETRVPRASSQLGVSINNFADQVETLTDCVNSLTRRCEL